MSWAGEASDELFGGYPILYGPQYRRFLTAPQMLRRLVEEARGPHGYTWIRMALLARLRGRPVTPEVIALPTEVLRERQATRQKAQQAYAHHPGPRGQLEAELLNGLSSGSFPFLLNRMDKDLMAHSVETRLPFLDLEVVSLVVNLPLEHRVAPATKGILRDVARRWIPESIVRRPKQPGLQFDSTRRIEEAARPEFLEHGYLRDLIPLPADDWRGVLDRTSQRTRLWTAEIWCRLFIEKQDVASVERDLWVSETT